MLLGCEGSGEAADQKSEETIVLKFHRMTEDEKYKVCGWKYEGEYAIYNNPPYKEQLRDHSGFANPKNSFYSFYDEDKLVGFINLFEEEKEVFLGIGVAPDHCSKGYGQQMCRIACDLSKQLFAGKTVYLEVRTWNTRAVKCYEKAGFRIVGDSIIQTTPIGTGEFYHMTAQ